MPLIRVAFYYRLYEFLLTDIACKTIKQASTALHINPTAMLDSEPIISIMINTQAKLNKARMAINQ
ncbi:hypothetical protein [Shewanella sp. TC10]|uniref:hypothetical protein n=1 Tax=Shewanella sp. TC10 TaxID=1419739 RepID=UPI00129DE836|nr:hypothetical protein [Shewanella sp. TC10]